VGVYSARVPHMADQSIDLTGLAADLGQKAEAVRGLVDPALRECGEVGLALVRDCFDQSRDPAGVPWEPLRYPRKDGSTGRPLAGLRDFTHYKVDAGAGGGTLTVFNDHPYADVHNSGAVVNYPEQRRGPGEKPFVFAGADGGPVFTRHVRAHTKTIPKRTFLDFSPDWVRVWVESVTAVVRRALGGR
jgi:phage gpG-like protein